MSERQRLEKLFDVLYDAKQAHLATYKPFCSDSEWLVWYHTYHTILDGLRAVSRQLGERSWAL